TLTRICTHRQTPLQEVDPAIPAPLSALVDRLLEKEPARRPQSAREVAASLAGLGSGALEAGTTLADSGMPRLESRPPAAGSLLLREPSSSQGYGARRPSLRWVIAFALLAVLAAALLWEVKRPGPAAVQKPEPPLRVVVRRPEIGAGAGENAQLLASSLRISLLRSLLSFSGLSPTEGDDVTGAPAQVARALGVQELLTSRLDCVRESCQISLQRVRGSDGQTLW